MVRIQVKEIEGVIAIVIFISFLTFYLASYRNFIMNKIDNYNEINYYNIYIENILNNIESNYYLLSLNITIPDSMYYQCLSNSSIYYGLIYSGAYNDFCTSFPIFYPLNISFLTNYTGVLNNTNNTFLDPNIGLYFYLNITNLTINNQPQYVLINISNPTNNNINAINLFITSPMIFYWLQEGYYLEVYDLNSNNYIKFCYQNQNFNCGTSNSNSYGIFVNLSIPANSYILLNISPTNDNDYATDGKKIFAFYYYNTINSPGYTTTISANLTSGYYLVTFNGYSYGSGSIQIGNCNINVPSNPDTYYYYCNLTQNVNQISLNNVNINYLIILYYNPIAPVINYLYQPNITSTFNFIIGPNLTYDFSQYNDLGYTSNGIYNQNIIYGEESYSYNIYSYTTYYSSFGYRTSNITLSFQPLFNSLYTSQYEPYYLNSSYIENDSLSLLYLYSTQNLSIKKIIFSNTYWFIINTQKYYNSNNMIFWNTSQNSPGFQYNYTNAFSQIISYDDSLLNGYLYFPYENGISLYSNNLETGALLFTNYNPMVNIIYSNNNNLLYMNLLNNYTYQNYYLYFYDNPNLNSYNLTYLSFSTQVPTIKINYIEPVNVINLNNLLQISENYTNVYFYFKNENITIYNGTIYQGNTVNNYSYSQEYYVYVLNTTEVNTLYKDKLIIYIK